MKIYSENGRFLNDIDQNTQTNKTKKNPPNRNKIDIRHSERENLWMGGQVRINYPECKTERQKNGK